MKEMKLDPLQLHRLKSGNQSEIDPGPKKNNIFLNEHPYSVRRFCLDTTSYSLWISRLFEHVQNEGRVGITNGGYCPDLIRLQITRRKLTRVLQRRQNRARLAH